MTNRTTRKARHGVKPITNVIAFPQRRNGVKQFFKKLFAVSLAHPWATIGALIGVVLCSLFVCKYAGVFLFVGALFFVAKAD